MNGPQHAIDNHERQSFLWLIRRVEGGDMQSETRLTVNWIERIGIKKRQPEARVSFGLPIISSSEFPNFLPAEVYA
jgi:hypothetical protein